MKRPSLKFELTLAPPGKKSRKATGAARGRKSLPQVSPSMTPAALKRFLVAQAAHTARIYHASMEVKVTWKEAIERAINETAYQCARDPKTGTISFLPIFVDDDGNPLVTFAAVERQLFPRTRDRKKAPR